MSLSTTHQITETQAIVACGLCHRISRSPADGYTHLEEVHPRRWALAKERRHGTR